MLQAALYCPFSTLGLHPLWHLTSCCLRRSVIPPRSPTPTGCLNFTAMNQARRGHLSSNLLLPLVLETTNATTKLYHPPAPQRCLCHGVGCPWTAQPVRVEEAHSSISYPPGCCIISATTGHLKAYRNIEFDMLKHRHFTSSTQTIKPRTEYSKSDKMYF